MVLSVCDQALINGRRVPMTEEVKNRILAQNKEMADKALRVLAVAMKAYPKMPEDASAASFESGLCFIGLAGMIDPVRPEAVDAIKEAQEAGIRPIMITGDHKDTAVAIAKELGIATDASQAITGVELNSISDEQLEKDIEKYSVYARVQPEHKVRIVNAWRKTAK